jgi:hypothetical protein
MPRKKITTSNATIKTQGAQAQVSKSQEMQDRKKQEKIGRQTMTNFKNDKSLLKEVMSLEQQQELLQSEYTSYHAQVQMGSPPKEALTRGAEEAQAKQHTANASMFSSYSRGLDNSKMKNTLTRFHGLLAGFENLLKEHAQNYDDLQLQGKLSQLSEQF